MAGNDTLCGWGNSSKVNYFLENAEVIIPRRAEQIDFLLELLPPAAEAALSFLDLGAGFGAITERILAKHPRASVTCVDGSPAMIALAIERLGQYGNRVRIIHADLAEASWRSGLSGPFDAIVSAIAIHHLTDQRKRELYREARLMLKPGGIFLNNDVVATPPALKSRFEALNLAIIQQQDQAKHGAGRSREQIQAEMREQLRLAGPQHQSHIAALNAQLKWLVEAGLDSVDCYWRYLDLAIFGGVKA